MFNIPQVNTALSDGVRQGWVNNVQRHLNRSGNYGMTETGSQFRRQRSITYLAKQPQFSTEENPINNVGYPVMTQFFNCHNRFSNELNSLIIQDSRGQFSSNNFYDPISNIISEYDQNLTHLPDYILDVFFDFTDLLEGVLLVSKRRPVDITDIRDILIKLNNSYTKIYSLMKSSNHNDISPIVEELTRIKEEIGKRRLLPTVEECEMEMEDTFAAMDGKEKKDLARLLRKD